MSIRQSTPPNLLSQPKIEFNKNDFDATIWNKGYPVIHYDAIECPCKGDTAPKVDCQNCLGLGWVFINPIETRGIVTSINTNTQYKYWSPELKGTIALTFRDVERLSFMDKVVFKDKYSVFSEVKKVRNSGTQAFVFASYPISDINILFAYKSVSEPLIRLQESEYSLSSDNPYVIKLNPVGGFAEDFNGYVSIDYKYEMQYNVVDLPHELRSSVAVDNNGKQVHFDLPVQAICQKSHYINGDSPKYDGTGVQDNSFL